MFEINGTYVIILFLFLIFIQLLNVIMLRPIGKVLEKRAQRVQDNIDAAKGYTQETEKVLNDYQARLHTSRSEAQRIIQEALDTAQKERDEKLKTVQTEGRNKLDELKAELTAGRGNLLQSLVRPELDLVQEIIDKLLGEKPALITDEERVFKVLQETR